MFQGMGTILATLAALTAADDPARTANAIGMDLVRVAPGDFVMGSETGDWDEAPTHKVTLSAPFLVSAKRVTLDQYRQFKPDHDAAAADGSVTGVSWNDAMGFCRWLSEKDGHPYRLPTEAEWEYACRAGSTTPFSSGDAPPADPGQPNAWGVAGMHDGQAEWCYDWYGEYHAMAQTDPVGPDRGLARVVRGDRLDLDSDFVFKDKQGPFYRRSANRASMGPAFGWSNHEQTFGRGTIGFRVVQAALPATKPYPSLTPFPVAGLKQSTAEAAKQGPDAGKPYFRKRYLLPTPPETSQNPEYDVALKAAGLHPAIGGHNHSPAFTVCPNGDLLLIIYTSWHEYEPSVSLMATRLRLGADQWDMPSPLVDFADANDHAPLLWADKGDILLFWGSPKLRQGAFPFQWTRSSDSGATWGDVDFPNFTGTVGPHSRQPINTALRAADGTIYISSDGEGGTSVLWATKDEGKTWYDTGGRSAGRHTNYALLKDGRILALGGKNTDIDGYMPQAVSSDGGKTWTVSKTVFPALAVNQRPSLLRLKSGRLFVASDYQKHKGVQPAGVTEKGSFVALSDDDGATWRIKKLEAAQPHESASFYNGSNTVGYSVTRQSQDGTIHLITTMNRPCLHFAFNEAWILSDAPMDAGDTAVMPNTAASVDGVREVRETYADGKPRIVWSAGIGNDGRYLLHGKERWYYEDGSKQYEVQYGLGQKTGLETYWSREGHRLWEWNHGDNGLSTWRQWWDDGVMKAESSWRNMHAEGQARCWDRDGKLVSNVTFHEGLLPAAAPAP